MPGRFFRIPTRSPAPTRWGEDGLAGFCDAGMRWCLGLALWNGNDPVPERALFGLSNGEGNHGEDVKEVYHYADALPSHAYNRMVYATRTRRSPTPSSSRATPRAAAHEPRVRAA